MMTPLYRWRRKYWFGRLQRAKGTYQEGHDRVWRVLERWVEVYLREVAFQNADRWCRGLPPLVDE